MEPAIGGRLYWAGEPNHLGTKHLKLQAGLHVPVRFELVFCCSFKTKKNDTPSALEHSTKS